MRSPPRRERDRDRRGGGAQSPAGARNGGGGGHSPRANGDGGGGAGAAADAKAGPGGGVDRQSKCPFLLRVFCSTSRHNPMADYNRGKVPANELQIYTWKDASLRELTSLIREVNPDARRRGTYFDFAVVYPTPRPSAATHYTSRDIGTTVSGQKGPDDTKTLGQTSFAIGDYLDVAITPPIGRGDRFGGGGGGGGRMMMMRGRGRDDGGGRGGGARFRPY